MQNIVREKNFVRCEPKKLTVGEKRHCLLGLTLTAPPGNSIAAATKSIESEALSIGKGIESLQVPALVKTVEAPAASSCETVEGAGPHVSSKSVAAAVASGAAYASIREPQNNETLRRSSSIDLESEPNLPSSMHFRQTTKFSKDQQIPETIQKLDSPEFNSPSVAVPSTSSAAQQAQDHYEGRQDQHKSVLDEARAKLAMVEKRAIKELQLKVAAAEAKAKAIQEKGQERARGLEKKMMKLEDELRDSAAIEVALYSVVAEHGSSSHKLHTPARRLARLYMHAYKNWSTERRASSERNSVLGLVLVVRACGNDVPRFGFGRRGPPASMNSAS